MDFVEKKIREEKALEAKKIEQAYARTPKEYHEFIVLLEQNKKIFTFEAKLNDELKSLGAYIYKGATYLTLQQPYMSVDGRTLWWNTEHLKDDDSRYKYEISSNLDMLCQLIAQKGSAPAHYPLVVRVNSEKYGLLEDVSTIFWGGSGANSTNAIENAYTSALGRIYGRVGIGLIGTGIASAEEVANAMVQQANLETAYPKAVGGESSPPPPAGVNRSDGGKVVQMPARSENLVTLTVTSDAKISGPYRLANAVTLDGEAVLIAVTGNTEFSKGSVITGSFIVSEPANGDQPAKLVVNPTKVEQPTEPPAEDSETVQTDNNASDQTVEQPEASTASARKRPEKITVTITSDPQISGKFRIAEGQTEDGKIVKVAAYADAQEFKSGDKLTAPYEAKDEGKLFLKLPKPRAKKEEPKSADTTPPPSEAAAGDSKEEPAANAEVKESTEDGTLVLTATSDVMNREVSGSTYYLFGAQVGDKQGICGVLASPENTAYVNVIKTVKPGDRIKGIFLESQGVNGYNWHLQEFKGVSKG